ncbi:hypothetical protein [Corynebacterium marinum]|uniref:Uncharacterized protein n=1 Tax=Corynebacterium marinum DSM 44953 TaxID=1224162 RepID=A0A0B6TV15_9CORY|nr:hypothetical protein [Corynebacterium marinum]AJK69410.1 Hypothetical protein B840_09085 [Corynebacterium marinum DSM 44953]GGO21779.1 hypothetical protein GCM10010980_23240 [Corynebacterium marinum]
MEHAGTDYWVWVGNELFDTRRDTVARVRSDVIFFDSERMLIESEPGPYRFRARATTGDGRVFTMSQNGLTVGCLDSDCDGRTYTLRRTSVWRKERHILDADGDIVAHIRPLISGRVEVHPGAAWSDLPLIDAVFLSWGCVLVDSPVRRPRM